MSQISNKECGLSSNSNGGTIGIFIGSSILALLGPNNPICNHKDEEPGPPLYANITGLFLLSSISFLI